MRSSKQTFVKFASCYIEESHSLRQCYRAKLSGIYGMDTDFELSYSICEVCGFIIQTPRPTIHSLKKYYANNSSYDNLMNYGKPLDIEVSSVARQLDILRKNRIKIGSAFDIGCSTGYFLHILEKEGFSVLGIDPSPYCREIAHKLYNIKVLTEFVENISIERFRPFQLIALRHVLEHVQNPFTVLRKIWKAIDNEGYILIEVPLFDEPEHLPFGFFTFEHLTYFTMTVLKKLLYKTGFKIIETRVTTSQQDNSLEYPVLTLLAQKTLKRISSDNCNCNFNDIEKYMCVYKNKEKNEIVRISNILRPYIEESITNDTKIILWGAGIHLGY